MSQSSQVLAIYKSRKFLLELLKEQGYNIDDYFNITINETHIRVQQNQQDMLMTNPTTGKKVYVKYHLDKTLRQNNMYELIEDLFDVEEILTKTDDLVVIIKDEPNDGLIKLINEIYKKDKHFIIIYNIARLQYNILDHSYVPSHKILNEEEVLEIKNLYNIKSNSNLPGISRFDPVAQAIGIRPGQICEIERASKTAITSKFYRVCT
jgi:DNA-directed RNA polymerase subunit H (RpoH/RPB5)